MSNILITGAGGFIGANLVHDLINTKDLIHILIKKESNLWRLNNIISKCYVHFVDISKIKEVENVISEIKPETVYHCATYGVYPNQKDTQKIDQTNLIGTKNLVSSLAKNTDLKRLVNLGSVFEYGSKPGLIKETDSAQGLDHYSKSKILQTKMIEDFFQQHNLPAVTLRVFTVYGNFEEPGRLISDIMVAIIKKNPIKILSSSSIRDFIYINDVIDALKKISVKPGINGEIFNVGSGRASSVENIVNLVCNITNTDSEVIWQDKNDREHDKAGTKGYADIQKIEKIGWKPKISLEDGLEKTYEWFKKNIEYY